MSTPDVMSPRACTPTYEEMSFAEDTNMCGRASPHKYVEVSEDTLENRLNGFLVEPVLSQVSFINLTEALTPKDFPVFSRWVIKFLARKDRRFEVVLSRSFVAKNFAHVLGFENFINKTKYSVKRFSYDGIESWYFAPPLSRLSASGPELKSISEEPSSISPTRTPPSDSGPELKSAEDPQC